MIPIVFVDGVSVSFVRILLVAKNLDDNYRKDFHVPLKRVFVLQLLVDDILKMLLINIRDIWSEDYNRHVWKHVIG